MAKNKINTNKFLNLKVVLLIIFGAIFGGLGAYLLGYGSAASVSPDFVSLTSAREASFNNPALTLVPDHVPYLSQQTVVELKNRQSANFAPNRGGGNPKIIRHCYSLRAIDTAAKVRITSGAGKAAIDVPASFSYQKYCVNYVKGTGSGFDVKHLSGGPVYVAGREVIFQDKTQLAQ